VEVRPKPTGGKDCVAAMRHSHHQLRTLLLRLKADDKLLLARVPEQQSVGDVHHALFLGQCRGKRSGMSDEGGGSAESLGSLLGPSLAFGRCPAEEQHRHTVRDELGFSVGHLLQKALPPGGASRP
jgi:hypothetical protein